MAKRSVTIKDVQTIRELTFDMPSDEGGVLVMRGKNATGKSTAIAVIESLVSGRGRLNVRDHAARGQAEGFGSSVSITKTTRRSGEPDVVSLAGRFDFSDLVDPPVQSEEARDKKRIKALLGLTGAKADPSLFYSLVGGQAAFEQIVPVDDLKTDDLVEMSGRIFRAIHAEAKKLESNAEHEAGHAKGLREAVGDADLETVVDIVAARKRAVEANNALTRLQMQSKAATDSDRLAMEARIELDKARESYSGTSPATAGIALRAAEMAESDANEAVLQIRMQLQRAEREAERCENVVKEAKLTLEIAEAHYNAIGAWERQIESANSADRPSAEDFVAAQTERDEAEKALANASNLASLRDKALRATKHEETAKELKAKADVTREAARSVDHVLSQQIPAGPLRAEGGRLVLDTERGKGVPYDQCSDGERWDVALQYAIVAVGEGGVIPVAQSAWQDLDTERRNRVAETCQKHRVWIVTAEVADGELRAEVYQQKTLEEAQA